METKFKNGDKVKDTITGFEGTIVCVAVYLNGCIRYSIQPKIDKAGLYQESETIDEEQLELIKEKKPYPKCNLHYNSNQQHNKK